jgi:hypothetical protein
MRVLTPIVEMTALTVLHVRKDLTLRGTVAFEFIGNDDPWHGGQALE